MLEQEITSESETEILLTIGGAEFLVSLETKPPMIFQTAPEEEEIETARWDPESRRIIFADAAPQAAEPAPAEPEPEPPQGAAPLPVPN